MIGGNFSNHGSFMGFVSDNIEIKDCNGIKISETKTNSQNKNFSVSLTPNPATNKVKINGLHTQDVDFVKVSLLDLNGGVLKRFSFSKGEEVLMDISDLPIGVYFAKIILDEAVISTQKLLISN